MPWSGGGRRSELKKSGDGGEAANRGLPSPFRISTPPRGGRTRQPCRREGFASVVPFPAVSVSLPKDRSSRPWDTFPRRRRRGLVPDQGPERRRDRPAPSPTERTILPSATRTYSSNRQPRIVTYPTRRPELAPPAARRRATTTGSPIPTPPPRPPPCVLPARSTLSNS